MIIRQATINDVTGIAKVHVDSWKTTYAGIVCSEYLDKLSYSKRETLWTAVMNQGFEKSSLLVVEDSSGQIIGFANGGKERSNQYEYDAEIYAIYLLKEYQGQKIGSKLVHALTEDLVEKGYNSLLVWVLAENPSRTFYESFQPEEVDSMQVEIGGQFFEEIAYGWKISKVLLG
ncbi:GNAT family N-acetyltransferase [Bacillus timonensis]|nr:GNAT family N-acetyltransferase [Bacillus timonensis]